MIIVISILAVLTLITFLYMMHPKFGKAPEGNRLELIKTSANYSHGKFQNTHDTPTLTKGYSFGGILYDQLFGNHPRREPVDSIPSIKTDLHNLPPNADVLIWFGHSSYFMQIDGKRFLVDPVFSGNASPLPGTVSSFKGANGYTVADLPTIDYLFISHDHYDHLDYETIIALKSKVKKVICGLGVGGHFERWGYPTDKIIEKDWNETIVLEDGFKVYTTPARHFSGRGFSKNNTLWLSYVLQTPSIKIYIGGDSGYDSHFAKIGEQYGPIDFAILENGQYNLAWEAIHMLPEQVLKAAQDLKTKKLFPVHSSKFKLAMHAWDEPLSKLSELSKTANLPLVTPMIGEIVNLNDDTQVFKEWWKDVN
ncbi:MBL fold metallo-hydrolase [Flavobacterium sp. LS1R49]|uniref:MBL fold metallo-hydrolase n=1 Tax=Flavobacterium shii TaxID=2987687 RepID=A0A9X2Z9H8_9FLAO|nr:MBL fold metallo-hydrolase [Flavobacterium shii]MCV9926559.1 MBL fold metallo-hydrolase [Flavobacterium shii]